MCFIYYLIQRVQAGAAGVGDAGVFSLLRNVFAKEGVAGLYRGVSAPIAAVSPIFAVSFWGYDMGKRLVRMAAPESAQNEDLSLSEICVAGAISSLPTTMIMVRTLFIYKKKQQKQLIHVVHS